jgi:hypothetical protein
VQPVIDGKIVAAAAYHFGFYTCENAISNLAFVLNRLIPCRPDGPAKKAQDHLGISIDEFLLFVGLERIPVRPQRPLRHLGEIESAVNEFQSFVRQTGLAQFRYRGIDQNRDEFVHGRAELRRRISSRRAGRRDKCN